MHLIGLAGLAGSGKDTVADYIAMSGDFQRIAFADPLKRVALFLCGLTRQDVTDRTRKETVLPEWGLSPRQIMQRLGTEVGRQIHSELWVRHLDRTIQRDAGRNWIITDCRFRNEIAYVRRQGGTVWWVNRPSVTPVSDHASERHVTADDCDLVIENSGTLDELRNLVSLALFLQDEWKSA